jgi:hypothetical protein
MENIMFRDFAASKTQLIELSEIINKFKSEAVQLRLVELLFNNPGAMEQSQPNTPSVTPTAPSARSRTKRKSRAKPAQTNGKNEGLAAKKKTSSGGGAAATLLKVYDEGYFKQPRSISDICKHCEVNLARRIKPNEISGKLGRMVRNGELTRTKNADNQYVYTKA